MNDDRIYFRKPTLLTANLGEELAVLDLATDSYLGFNATAARVWRLLQAPCSREQICQAMLLEFEVDAERCRHEVTLLIENLLAADLIVAGDATLA